MNDFTNLDKTIVRELSCRLCLCNDIVKLKPLSAELKRKLKKLFNITVRLDDFLPKAICHDCSQQVSALYLYSVKVEKNQKFLSHYEHKRNILKQINSPTVDNSCPLSPVETNTPKEKEESKQEQHSMSKSNVITTKQRDSIETKSKGKKSSPQVQYLEAMSLDEFSELESVDKSFLIMKTIQPRRASGKIKSKKIMSASKRDNFKSDEVIDPIVLVDGKPAKQGAELDKQISLFYKMECFICHEDGFKFKSLMTHYKDRHGVPGYVACCEKKFHYFYPKKIIEHMAYHLQPNIFSCPSCHTNFQTSNELNEHRINGGRSDGKIICPRCSERYPTYHELGVHIVAHRTDTLQCDYCGKTLKHHHRKKTVNHMEDLILCSQCLRLLKNIEKQEKEKKEKSKETTHRINARKINSTAQKIRQAMGLEVDGEANNH